MQFTEAELKEILNHAKTRRFGPDHTLTDYSDPFQILGYCSERLSQIPFQLGFDPEHIDRDFVIKKLVFFNGVIGRVVFLESQIIHSSSYFSFQLENGENQIDIFLSRIGYEKN